MKVKSPPQITGEKTGTMGALTILVRVGRYQSNGTNSQSLSGTGGIFHH